MIFQHYTIAQFILNIVSPRNQKGRALAYTALTHERPFGHHKNSFNLNFSQSVSHACPTRLSLWQARQFSENADPCLERIDNEHQAKKNQSK